MHSDHLFFIQEGQNISENNKVILNNKYPFLDINAYESTINNEYDAVVFSLLKDMDQDMYLDIETSISFPYGGYRDYTNKKIYEKAGKLNQQKGLGKTLGVEFYKTFAKNTKYLGPVSEKIFKERLEKLYKEVQCPLILINGVEIEFVNENEKNAHLRHKIFNNIIDEFIKNKPDVYLLDVRNFIKVENLQDNIRHYDRIAYKKMSDNLLSILSNLDSSNSTIGNNILLFLNVNFIHYLNKMKAFLKRYYYIFKHG